MSVTLEAAEPETGARPETGVMPHTGARSGSLPLLHQRVEVSVVLPAHQEAANIGPLVREIADILDGHAAEIIVVDDASTDDTRAVLLAARAQIPRLRVICHRSRAGQSRAVQTGTLAARGEVIATLDGDGQNDPADLPRLIATLTRADAPSRLALVQGERRSRADVRGKRWASGLANSLRGALLGDGARDSGCGARAFRRKAFLDLPFFDHMHRFLPALMQMDGHGVEFVEVGHRERLHGRSHYTNFARLRAGISDLQGVMWLRKRRRAQPPADEI